MGKNRPAKITVQAHFEDHSSGKTGELISKNIPIEVLPFESEVAEVEVNLGLTMPTKVRFLMVRMDVRTTLPTYPEERDKAREEAFQETKKELIKRFRELKKDLIPWLQKQI